MSWRLLFFVALAAGFAWVGATIKGKFDRAADADRLQTANETLELTIEHERDRTKAADEARVKLSGELDAARSAVRVEVREVVKRIRVAAPSDGRCDIPVDVIKQLNAARGHAQ